MDRVRKKSKFALIKKAGVSIAVTIALGYGGISIAKIDFNTRRVDRDTLLIGTVQQGQLEIRVSANGMLLPLDIELIAAQVEGRVAKVLVDPGDSVKAGQILVTMSNPQILNAAEEAYSAWEGAVAEQQAFVVELQNSLLNQQSITMQARFAHEREKLQLMAEGELIEDKIIPQIDYLKTQLRVEQLAQTLVIERKRLQQTRDNREARMQVRISRVTQLARALDRANNNVSNLQVIAGIDSTVQELNLELGQQLVMGSPIGRLAREGALYAELRVPARQAGDVVIGQKVMIDTRNGTVDGTVSRIDPGVTQGIVIVDVDIHDTLPRGARPQLQVEGIIYIAQIPNAVFVGKPTFTRTDAEVSIYKLDAAEEYAQRINVRLGRASVNRVEILGGLSPGEKVILSDSSDWQDHERILLN